MKLTIPTVLTLFRIALSPAAPLADSPWRANQVYMGHFALTDVADNRHYQRRLQTIIRRQAIH